MATKEQVEHNSQQVKPLLITPELTEAQADILGVIAFSFELNKWLATNRSNGKQWHKNEIPIRILKMIAKNCITENKLIEAAAFLMMAWNIERMENEK